MWRLLAAAAGLLAVVCSSGGPGECRSRVPVDVPQEEQALLLQVTARLTEKQPAEAAACTAAEDDPYVTGRFVACCAGLQQCLGDWFHENRWHYRCFLSCALGMQTPSAYHPHFDTTPDYLGITARARGVPGGQAGSVADNFYLVISDAGGCDGGCASCCDRQMAVARQMRNYVAARLSKNPNSQLLFVIAAGDNFYWTGASEGRFAGTWSQVYGADLTAVPWFTVMGNHDYGDNDPGAACPFVKPRFTCGGSNKNDPACGGAAPYSTETQGYDSNQLSYLKGGVDGKTRANWVAPDYTYFYSIPGLDFELIAMDWNALNLNALGGGGTCTGCGAAAVLQHCGSRDALAAFLASVQKASTDLLANRSATAAHRNVAIVGHYPDKYQPGSNFRNMFINGLPAGKKDGTKVFNFYGHDHTQQCMVTANGECVEFLTGGAGGCCGTADVPAGFVAISWNTAGTQVVECFSPDSRCTLSSFAFVDDDGGKGAAFNESAEVCPHTRDDPRCPPSLLPEQTA